MQDTQENYFTAENIKKHISISVDATYWFNKEGRILQDMADLYNCLFPMELEREETDLKRRKWLKAKSFQRAQELWLAIKKHPQSPPGPLTLAVISKAILAGADFDDITDREAFFILMQHNQDCRLIYQWAMCDAAVRANENEASIRQLKDALPALVPTDDEARRLIRLWHGETDRNTSVYNSINTKIKMATQTKNNTFYKELFEIAPKLAQSYSSDSASPLYIGTLAKFNPAVVEAVCLGFEQPLGFLSRAVDQLDMLRILTQNIVWYNVIMNGRKVMGSFSMKFVYNNSLLDSGAFLAQVGSPQPELDPRNCFQGLSIKRDCLLRDANKEPSEREYVFTLMPDVRGVEVVPNHSDLLEMFGEMANLVRNGLMYFIRYRRSEILVLIGRMADLNFLEEEEQFRSLSHELRYRLYHPVTIRAMEAFWYENIDAFICAIGKNEQNLAHMLSHLNNPASLLRKMLQHDKPWFVSRIAKLLPVIAKNQSSRAQKDFDYLLNEVVSPEGVEPVVTVAEHFRARVSECIDNYAAHFTDAGEELFSILDDPATRHLARLSAQQVGQCLSTEIHGATERTHSRLEMIIAQDDELFEKVPKPSALLEEASNLHEALEEPNPSAQLEKYKSLYPTNWARFRVGAINQSGNLNDYVMASNAPRGVKVTYKISVREAYVIASHDNFWRKIAADKNTLSGKNPILGIRREWEQHRDKPFDRFLVDRLYSILVGGAGGDVISANTKTAILELIADVGRGEELFNLHLYGESAVPQNPSRAKAFLAEINTPEKAEQAWDFVQQIDPANIDAEAIFCLMARDEQPSAAQIRSGKTCYDLAVSLLEKNPSYLHQIILMHTRGAGRLPYGAMERLSRVVKNWLNDEQVATPEVLQELMRASLLGAEFSTDIKLLRRLISVEITTDLHSKIKAILFPGGDSSPENSRQSEQKPLNGARSDNGYLRDKLCANDLLRLKEIAPLIFNNLMRQCMNLRQLKLCPAINKMSAQELSKMSFTGLGYLFAKEPKFFYELLLRLPVEKLDPPAELIGTEYDDIFMLNRLKGDDGHHPLWGYMKEVDLFQQENIDLVMRCVNSQNRYLSRLMKEVLVRGIDEYTPKLVGELLRRYLMHPQASDRLFRVVLEDESGVRAGVKRALLETNFVSVYLDKDKSSGKFSEQTLKLWSVLLRVKSFKEFVNSLQFDRSNEEQAAKEKTLFRLYSEYKVIRKKSAKAPGLSLIAKDFSDIFSDSVSQGSVFADDLSENNYMFLDKK